MRRKVINSFRLICVCDASKQLPICEFSHVKHQTGGIIHLRSLRFELSMCKSTPIELLLKHIQMLTSEI